MSGFAVILLRTNTAAHRAEKLLASAAIDVRLVPVPRELATACGVAVRVPADQWERAEQTLQAAGLDIAAVHRQE